MDWKHWDGLADEQGPIPAFGPARTDEQGRGIVDPDAKVLQLRRKSAQAKL